MIKREPANDISLSSRQSQLLELLIEGKSNKEISSELKIEPGTVKQHLFVLFRKLGVNSRAKAAVVAAQIMKTGVGHSSETKGGEGKAKTRAKSAKNMALLGGGYSWRLVSAVAVSLADLTKVSASAITQRDHFISALREMTQRLVDALDGRVNYLPDGGSLVWFGHPKAHLYDAERAVYFAQLLQNWVQQYQEKHPALNSKNSETKNGATHALLGIGLASHTEVVAEKLSDLIGAESFRKATILSQHAKSLQRPLADQLTKTIAPMSSAWLGITSKEGKGLVVKEVGPVVVVGLAGALLPDVSRNWGDFSFLSHVHESIHGGLAQWLSVESWPPASATLLIDALGNELARKQFQVIKLRTPSSQRRDQSLASFAAQIELQFSDFVSRSEKIYPSQGERVAGLLSEIAKTGPLTVLIYGLKALDAFKSVIGDAGIDRLASRQIVIIAANLQDKGAPQISVRLLGPKPNAAAFSRVFNLKLPAAKEMPEGIRVDLRAMLDSLNPISRALVMQAANNMDAPILSLLANMNEPHHKAQAAIQELADLGLIAPSQDGGFEFRDLNTSKAIKQLSVPISTEKA